MNGGCPSTLATLAVPLGGRPHSCIDSHGVRPVTTMRALEPDLADAIPCSKTVVWVTPAPRVRIPPPPLCRGKLGQRTGVRRFRRAVRCVHGVLLTLPVRGAI